MKIIGHGATDVGKKRGHNEDFFLINEDLGLYIVCDGMGGHAAGEVASRTAAEKVESYLKLLSDELAGFEDMPSGHQQLERIIRKAIEEACKAVYTMGREEKGKHGMGTTLTMVFVKDKAAVMGHVGDSRLYLLRDGDFHQLSRDHTLVQNLLAGGLPLEKAMESNMAHILTRSVGSQESVKIDTLPFDLIDGDRLLLCSDGLVGHILTPEELAPLMAANATAEDMVAFGNERSGADNITAVVIDVVPDDSEAPGESDHDKRVLHKIGAVGRVWLFERLDLREKALVMAHMTEALYKKGEAVIAQGERSNQLFIVLDGVMSVERDGEVVAWIGSGEHFGEMAMITGRTRTATVCAKTGVGLLAMTNQSFRDLIDAYPKLGNKLLWTLGEALIQRLDRG